MTVNGQMIALAREAKGLNQSELAKELGVRQATISRYEAGTLEVPHEHLETMAAFLSRPVTFFSWDERIYGASCLYHRKQQRVGVKELKRIHANANILRMAATRLLRKTEIVSSYSFHRLDLQAVGSPEEAARRLRNLWQLPLGPISNLVNSIESAGGVVFRCPFGTKQVDGISQWPLDAPDLPPVFFVSADCPGDRARWTLAHEIGHVVMHHMPTMYPEPEANEFAAEFLMPRAEIGPELKNLTLPKAAALKSHWKVSMQAIINWARRLGQITENQHVYLYKQLTMRGYRLCEPVPIVPEEPRLVAEMLRVHRADSGKNMRGLGEYIGETEEEFLAKYSQDLTGLRLVS